MQKLGIRYVDSINLSRLRYVIDFLRQHPLCPDDLKIELINETETADFILDYGVNSNEKFQMPFQNQFLQNGFSPSIENFEIREYSHQNEKLQSVELKATKRAQKEFFHNGKFGFDVFEAIFCHISRFEEWNLSNDRLDLHDRMKSEEMILVKSGFEKIPVVDRLVFALFVAFGFQPKNRPTKIHLSHDIDMIQKFPNLKKVIFAFGNMVLKQRDLGGFFRLTKQYLNFLKTGKDPFDTFDWLLAKGNSWNDSNSSNEYGIASKTLFILSGGEVPRIEKHFDLKNPIVLKFINLAKSRGYEIGIHPSYNAHLKKVLFKKEKEALENLIGHEVYATRQHFLRWKFPETPRIIQELGLKTDSTLGFADRIGFRCGTGYPCYMYDFEKERAFDFLEIPMVVMDGGLMRDEEFKTDNSYFGKFLKSNSINTQLTFNLHNSGFDEVIGDLGDSIKFRANVS